MKRRTQFTVLGLLFALLLALFLVGGCASSGSSSPAQAPEAQKIQPIEKIKITSLDELPVHTYPIKGTMSELLDDRAALAELRIAFHADIEADLAKSPMKPPAIICIGGTVSLHHKVTGGM